MEDGRQVEVQAGRPSFDKNIVLLVWGLPLHADHEHVGVSPARGAGQRVGCVVAHGLSIVHPRLVAVIDVPTGAVPAQSSKPGT